MIGCILLGSFATLAIFFATTTFYYRKKARALQYGGKVIKSFLSENLLLFLQSNSMTRASGGSERGRGEGSRRGEGGGGKREREGKSKSRRKKELSWKYPQVGWLFQVYSGFRNWSMTFWEWEVNFGRSKNLGMENMQRKINRNRPNKFSGRGLRKPPAYFFSNTQYFT